MNQNNQNNLEKRKMKLEESHLPIPKLTTNLRQCDTSTKRHIDHWSMTESP